MFPLKGKGSVIFTIFLNRYLLLLIWDAKKDTILPPPRPTPLPHHTSWHAGNLVPRPGIELCVACSGSVVSEPLDC